MRDISKFLGVMFWGAIGDALGSATEFLTPDKFALVKDFQWRPKFRTKHGYDAIPERWKTQVTNKELLAQFAQSFYQHSMK